MKILVSGGSRGIGAAVVRRLCRDGAEVNFLYAASEDAATALSRETGATALRPASVHPVSLEILPVAAHFHRGRYVAPHLHLNLTYLLIAEEAQALRAKPDENSGVRWFSPQDAVAASTEPDMRVIYEKLNGRLNAKGD